MSINSNSTNLQLDTKRHSFAHLMAAAVGQLFPEASRGEAYAGSSPASTLVQYGVGPVIENGCYYDFVLPRNLIPEDLPLLENHIKDLLKRDLRFKVQELSLEDAIGHFTNANQPLKVELLENLRDRGTTSMSEEEKADFGDEAKPIITIYRIVDEKTGEVVFEDLCKGPHVWGVRVNQESPKDLNLQNMGFKLDKFSASYWRGDQDRGINMQRLYALVFETKDELKEFIAQREEAKKRDHRVLGQQMKLFTISEMVGAGLTLMQPKGTIIRNLLQQYLWQIHKPHGYQQLWTPHIAKEDLYIRSGHAGHYMEDMFSVYGGTSKEKFYLKPMNCPHHMQVFADNQFSYRDMPVRYFEPATVYRDEKTGQLSGLARVRNITQDDGHVFCRIGGIQEEVTIFANAVKQFYQTMGMQADWVSLSVRDAIDRSKYLGTDENWDIAEKALEDAAIANGFNYKRVEGEAAFYGPKLDFMFKDCLGRQWQLSTIQCDFNLPERFDLSFKNEAGEEERPVVLHRAVAGSYERFMGIMIENYAGKFPFWLAPEQIRILTINDEVLPFVDKIKVELDKVVLMQPLKYNEIRYSVDDRMESLGKKIRDSKLDKIPMFIVVGMKDVEDGIVSIEYAGESVKVSLGEVKAWMENIKN